MLSNQKIAAIYDLREAVETKVRAEQALDRTALGRHACGIARRHARGRSENANGDRGLSRMRPHASTTAARITIATRRATT